ncbi:MAG: diguanylate cyclase [Chloroflexi bacterium]|nr:diguanylate cyclase [Chloroflexota bacterium]
MPNFFKSLVAWLEPPLERLEMEYRLYYLHPDIRQATIVGIIFIVGDLGLVAADFALFNQSETFFLLMVTRLLLAAVTAGLIVFLNRIFQPEVYDRFVFFCTMFIVVMAILIDTTRPINFLGRFIVYLVLVFAIYLVLPNAVIFRLGGALFLTGAAIVSMFALTDPTAEVLAVIMVVCLFVANWVGVYTSASYYKLRRREYQALQEARTLNRQLILLGETDSLTGIKNRQQFFELGAYELERCQRYQKALGLAVLDLDFFKQVNAVHGYQVGDQVLVALVMTILRQVPGTEQFGRLGDEEFGLLLPETASSAALAIAEQIRQRIHDSNELTTILKRPLTVSIGVCAAQPSDKTFGDLLRRADKALGRAKSEGRNCVVSK